MKPAVWAIRFPWVVLGLAVVLVLAGWAGIARFEQFVDSPGIFLRRQIVWSVIGLVFLLAATMPNYRIVCRWAYACFAAIVLLLLVVYAFPPINGAHRWIRIGPVGFQPSEFAKIAFVLALARYLMYRETHRSVRGLVVPFALALVPALLILREPDLGTAIVFLPVLLLMLYYAGARRRDLTKVCLAGLLVLPMLWTQMSREQRSRVTALFEQNAPAEKPTDNGYHLHQSKQMFALGGLWGSFFTGAAVDDPAAYHLPEAHTDFIFAVIGERFGLWGTGLLLILFCLLVWRGFVVAAGTREPFGRLVAAGLVSLFAVEVTINTAMTVGLAPITGLSLPLVSYGGSGLLAHAIALGLIVNVAIRPGYEITAEPFQFARSD